MSEHDSQAASRRDDERLFDHDPGVDPDAESWLAMDETERQIAVREAHEFDLPEGHPIPGAGDWELHSAMHVVAENQIAANDPPAAAQTLDRLRNAGVRRHDAIHAIASVSVEHIHAALRRRVLADSRALARDLRRIDAREWRVE